MVCSIKSELCLDLILNGAKMVFFFWLLHNSPKDGHSGFDKHIKGFQEHFVGKGRQVVVYTRCLPKK